MSMKINNNHFSLCFLMIKAMVGNGQRVSVKFRIYDSSQLSITIYINKVAVCLCVCVCLEHFPLQWAKKQSMCCQFFRF